jgi:putative membrane protein
VSRLLVRLIVNALALYAAVRLVPGISAEGSWVTFAAVAVILALVNALVRPLVAVLTCPLVILTLGLFTLVINGLMLWLAGALATTLGLPFRVDGFAPAFWGGLVISIVNFAATLLLGDQKKRD